MSEDRAASVRWIIDRLEQTGKSRAGLARAMGLDKAAVTRLLKGERKLLADELPIIRAYLEMDSPIKGDDSARRFVVNEIDVRGGAGDWGIDHTEILKHVGHGMTVRAHDVKAQWELPEAYIRQELRSTRDRVQIIEILGDSMSPTLESGDRVMIDTGHTTPSPPGIYALYDGHGVVVKRLELVHGSNPEAVRVISDNPQHGPYTVILDDAHVIGRVIWRATML